MAQKHYWQVTEDDFARATQGSGSDDEGRRKMRRSRRSQVARTEPHAEPAEHEKTPELPVIAASCDTVPIWGMGGTGLEPVTSTV